MKKDLELAGAVQTLLLPKVSSVEDKSLEMRSYYQTAAQAGGDWWWHDKTEDGKFRILVGDVTGHDAGAAMVTAALTSSYRTIEENLKNCSMPDLIRKLDSVITKICDTNYWVSFSAVEIDPVTGQCDWYVAGAPKLSRR
jgi:serine phosphatase RsbU (regulator of sigma subunit)